GPRRAGTRRYIRRRPSARHVTRPTSLRTRRCLETCGWEIDSSSTIAPTAFSPARNASRISRRCASAIALKTSDVVAARAMRLLYSHSGMCQGVVTLLGGAFDTVDLLNLCVSQWNTLNFD